ncbi:MAG: hypothetical protein ABH919_03345 [bacterium]
MEATKRGLLEWEIIGKTNYTYLCEEIISIKVQECTTKWKEYEMKLFVQKSNNGSKTPLCGLSINKGKENRVFVNYDGGKEDQVIVEALPFYNFVSRLQEIINKKDKGAITLEYDLCLALEKRTPFNIEG